MRTKYLGRLEEFCSLAPLLFFMSGESCGQARFLLCFSRYNFGKVSRIFANSSSRPSNSLLVTLAATESSNFAYSILFLANKNGTS